MTPSDVDTILEKASVPEHSVPFMQAMSGGEPFLLSSYLFIDGGGWLLAIGYPLEHVFDHREFEETLSSAVRRTRARECWAICPSLPERLKPHRTEQDHYYVLALDEAMPARLEAVAEKASAVFHVEEENVFTPEHRRLWAEFLNRTDLPPNVRELFARTEFVLPRAEGLSLLNAWDANGRLGASFLLDSAPRRFTSYLIGAHSRTHPVPHASDLLFREMIRTARRQEKEFLHLGLGVNEGIRRFKLKWGGKPALPYEMAHWEESQGMRNAMAGLMRVVSAAPAREVIAPRPQQRRFSMLFEIEKNGRRSWLGGTAHFFCYSFENSFRRLFSGVDTVLFEGPLDRASMDRVSEIGRNPPQGSPRIIDAMTEDELLHLERVVRGPQGFWAKLLGLQSPNPPDVRHLLSRTKPWMGFFSVWAGYLARQGWTLSVDLEAWHLAHEMGKSVRYMETIPEQIETLESIPMTRIVNFFRQCGEWKRNMRRNVRAYLRGDLDGMLGTSTEFPSRTEIVIHRRDEVFLERMLPYLEEGRCAVLVGTAHLIRLRHMLAEQGFSLRKRRC